MKYSKQTMETRITELAFHRSCDNLVGLTYILTLVDRYFHHEIDLVDQIKKC